LRTSRSLASQSAQADGQAIRRLRSRLFGRVANFESSAPAAVRG